MCGPSQAAERGFRLGKPRVIVLWKARVVTPYMANGFAGYAVFFAVAPLLLCLGSPRPRLADGFWLLGVLLAVVAARMFWSGSWLLVGCGAWLLVALAMTLSGLCPYVLETGVFASQSILAGYEGLVHYRRSSDRLGPVANRGIGLDVVLPLVALVAFGLLFVVANPDLLTAFGETIRSMLDTLRDWILDISPTWLEVVVWAAVLWISVGLLRPVIGGILPKEAAEDARRGPAPATSEPAPLYGPFRNTLVTVIVLFAVYLVFEFATLWGREFPKGFYYSGYAHEGAAWLTVALALATFTLSLIFRGRVLDDPRLPRLRRWAWIWSLENLLLAVAVYHRLAIYIGFNGMTRMRIVGILGMSCVVAGFLLVVWKIHRQHDFTWLVRRQLWALALTIFLYAILPVDVIAHGYNVRRILAGDPAPSVQISVHPISAEGVPTLLPLVRCDDEIIRQGVLAMLATRLDEAETRAERSRKDGWTARQMADRYLLDRLTIAGGEWTAYQNPQRREEALRRFHEYAYQWY